jgi:hypothetical protein
MFEVMPLPSRVPIATTATATSASQAVMVRQGCVALVRASRSVNDRPPCLSALPFLSVDRFIVHPTPLAFTPFGLVMEGYRSTPGRGVAPAVEIGVNRGRDPIDVIAAWQSDVPAAYHPAEVAALLPQGDG